MPKFRKKPVVIESIQWDGGNAVELLGWVGENAERDGSSLYIHTLEGTHEASLGDWIIKGVKGEFYPCKPEIFQMTYEPNTSDKQENITVNLKVVDLDCFTDLVTALLDWVEETGHKAYLSDAEQKLLNATLELN